MLIYLLCINLNSVTHTIIPSIRTAALKWLQYAVACQAIDYSRYTDSDWIRYTKWKW